MHYWMRFIGTIFLFFPFSFSLWAAETCPIYPYSIQSWSTSSTLTLGGSSFIKGTHNLTGKLGFGQILDNSDYKLFCDKKKCITDHSLLIAEPNTILPTFGNENFTYNSNSREVFIPEGNYDRMHLTSNTKFTFTGSNYQIKNLIINGGAKVNFPNQTLLVVNTASFDGGAIIKIKDNNEANLTIWAEHTEAIKAKIEVNIYPRILPNKESFSLMGSLFSRGNISLSGSTRILGSLTAYDITLGGGASVTYSSNVCVGVDNLYSISMSPNIDYSLICGVDKPEFAINTQKNSEPASLNVNVEILPAANVDDFIVTTVDGMGSGVFPHFLSNSIGQLSLTVALKNPQLAELNKKYSLRVTLDSDANQQVVGQFIYVPFKFKSENQLVIAGKEKSVDVSVIGCSANDGSESLISNYSGSPNVFYALEQPISGVGNLIFSPEFKNGMITTETNKLLFDNSGVVNIFLEDTNFDCMGFEHCPIDGGGVLNGFFTVKSRPWTFSICSPTRKIIDGYDYGGTGFAAAGERFELQLRPIVWQQKGSERRIGENRPVEMSSYCDANITTNFFLSDAPAATVQLRGELATPENGRLEVVMESAGSLDRLNTEKAAGNYFLYDDLTWQEVGSLYVIANTQYDYLGMNINVGYREIGRFYPHHFKLENDNDWNYTNGHRGFAYMNQPISMSYRVKAQSATGNDTENYGYFLPRFLASFVVDGVKKDTVSGSVVGDLSTRFCTDYDHIPVKIGDECKGVNGYWDKATYTFSSNHFIFWKDQTTDFDYTTTPDGPYHSINSIFGVAVDPFDDVYTNDDNVNFDENFIITSSFKAANGLGEVGIELFNQPNFRYGRMVLNSVGGPIGGPIPVPLKVEYWNGERFVVNSDDNGTRFKPDVYYVMSQVKNSSAKLSSLNSSNFHTVSKGRSHRLQAKQDNAMRETARLFLKQGNLHYEYANNLKPKSDEKLQETNLGWVNAEGIGQSWLQFNWRGKGDEDPSAVISFGTYRGNDRIIYRGEPNVTVH